MFHFSCLNSVKHVAERKLPKCQEGWVADGRARERGQLLYLIDEEPLLSSVDKLERGNIGGGGWSTRINSKRYLSPWQPLMLKGRFEVGKNSKIRGSVYVLGEVEASRK